MCQKNDLPLSLKSDTFNAFCSDFDQLLRQTLQGMVDTDQDTGEINCKVKITLTPDSAPDFSVRDQTRSITKPKFDHTVSAVIQRKDKKSGTLSGNYELVWDRESCRYVMRPIDNGQTTLFDEGMPASGSHVPVYDADYTVVDDGRALEGRKVAQLPAPVENHDSSEPTPFDWMLQFVGATMKVMEAMGNYTVRTSENAVVLSSIASEDSPFYAPAEKLEPHVGHELECIEGIDDEDNRVVLILCSDCGDALFSIKEERSVEEAQEPTEEEGAEHEDAPEVPTEDVSDGDAEEEGYDYEPPELGEGA